MGKIASGAADLNVLPHNDYDMGCDRKLIYLALVHLIRN
jgi:hypothetical protein